VLSLFPTEEKFKSLSSANNGSVDVVKWCFFFFSLFRIDTGGVAAATETAGSVGFAGPAGGADNKDNGSSTCAVYAPLVTTEVKSTLILTVFYPDQLIDEALICKLRQ
jgi:hypothetical protein